MFIYSSLRLYRHAQEAELDRYRKLCSQAAGGDADKSRALWELLTTSRSFLNVLMRNPMVTEKELNRMRRDFYNRF